MYPNLLAQTSVYSPLLRCPMNAGGLVPSPLSPCGQPTGQQLIFGGQYTEGQSRGGRSSGECGQQPIPGQAHSRLRVSRAAGVYPPVPRAPAVPSR
ncbi:hypothetical protein CEXT_769231 [Caerostris extrusa]|uniref:Uncharacterized protein n=1 Tax=Caerostris extrusa TaxID=172846 RepID=A0AAV4RUX6_CAEEX|nr:hypothetical protein CEXT_769231 [Caerostris extrusa]